MSKIALISVSNKDGIIDFAKNLISLDYKIISTGGTYQLLKENNIDAIEVSEHTGFPEIMDGRIKTLHPKIHAGILSRRKIDKKIIKEHSIDEIDIVVVNLYPFYSTAKDPNSSEAEIIEKIDIGGPTMLRAAAKNHEHVTTIVDPNDYDLVTKELKKSKTISKSIKKQLAIKVFSHTANYDLEISNYFNGDQFEENLLLSYEKSENLRYGENPHQGASVYSLNKEINIKQLNGKKLSYNNYNDIFTGISLSKSFTKDYSTVIIKHANPCGVALDKRKINSYLKAYECDPTSAFGGIISCNYKVDKTVAKEISRKFYEVVVANGFESGALKILKRKKNLRLIDSSSLKELNFEQNTSIMNNFLSQSSDTKMFNRSDFKIVSKAKPSNEILNNLLFTFNVCRFVKSNAIVISQNNATIGIGSGQPSRLDSCKIAVNKMKKLRKIDSKEKIVAASDAFFPFVDGIETLVQSGVEAIIQPSGSIRDKEIINFANKTNTILVFSKTRHFKH